MLVPVSLLAAAKVLKAVWMARSRSFSWEGSILDTCGTVS